MPFEESFLPLGQKSDMRRTSRIGQAHGEQRGLGLHPAQHHPQVMKVHLRLGRRFMSLRNIAKLNGLANLGEDFWTALSDMVTHRRIREPNRAMLIDQPRQDAPGGMALLLGRIQVTAQHGFDGRLERI
jgi:hypothetical protein